MRLRRQRARRKGRGPSLDPALDPALDPTLAPALDPALANAVATAHAAYQLCAKKTQDPNVAVAALNAAASLKGSFDLHLRVPRLGDRLRLEWLAAMRDADARLLGECARVLGDAISAKLETPASDRLRLASAEAYSLMQAVSRTDVSSSEAAWRAPAQSVAFLSLGR